MDAKVHYLIIAFILQFLLQYSGKSQEYLPFPQDSAEWYSVYSWPDPFPPYVLYKTYKYETMGDTIINNLVYTKLYSFLAADENPSYLGAYRVEPVNKKVYFIDAYYSTESLLYDYNLVPGDTIIVNGTEYSPYTLICYDTSSILINGSFHKQYYIHSYLDNGTECYTTWLEGIGSLRTPIETEIFCGTWFEGSYDLSCFYYRDEQIYLWLGNPFFSGCVGTNVNIAEYDNKSDISVSPNPVTNISRVISKPDIQTLFDYQIFDMVGNILQSEQNIKLSEISINNSHFSNGMYILILFSYELKKIFTYKFIINHI